MYREHNLKPNPYIKPS